MIRVRLTLKKNTAMRYTSHLDLQRALERTFRRAQLPLAYSEGFTPHARIQLASALPLGFTSEGEIADVWLNQEINPEDLLRVLQNYCPPGLEIVLVSEIIAQESSLPAQLQAAEYIITLRKHIPDLSQRIGNIVAFKELIRERRGKTYDLRPLIETIQEDQSLPQVILLRLKAKEGATGRPEEVLNAMGIPLHEANIHRKKLIFLV